MVILLAALVPTMAAASNPPTDTGPSPSTVSDGLAAVGFNGELSGVRGLLVFTGSIPDLGTEQVTMSRWRGTPADYARSFLDRRSSGLETPGEASHAFVESSELGAYGSTGDVPYPVEWAAISVESDTILILRAKPQDGAWVGPSLLDMLAAHVDDLNRAGFTLDVTEGFDETLVG